MKNIIILTVVCVYVFSCSSQKTAVKHTDHGKTATVKPTSTEHGLETSTDPITYPVNDPITYPVNDPITGQVNEPTKKVSLVNVISITNFTAKELEKAAAYIPVMNKTLASKCFEDFMLDRKLIETNAQENAKVVHNLRTRTVEIHLVMYYKRFSKVHGYTKPNVNKIWLNRKYHANASLCSEASNLAHELSHKLKYGHSYKATQSRPFSVPYSINAAFKVCCK